MSREPLSRLEPVPVHAGERDISPLVAILGTGAGPTDIARDKHVMVRQAFSEKFERQKHTRASHR